MVKVIFFFWMLSGKVQIQYDYYGVRNMHEGRQLYKMGNDSLLYKGEILNYIRTGVLHNNEMYSDKNGKVEDKPVVYDTISYFISKSNRVREIKYPLYRKGKKKWYVIDPYTERRIYLKMKR
jgi:hypothetical protein